MPVPAPRARFRGPFALLALAALALSAPATARADGGGHHGDDDCGLDQIFRLEHYVPLGQGRLMHVTETYSPRAFLRHGPKRAIVMLPGPLTTGAMYNVDVPGYDGGAIMAARGFFSYAVDFEGTGTSTMPTQGTSATLERQVDDVIEVVRYVRQLRDVPRVDLLGESWGGGVAAEVCQPRYGARSCVLASMIYRTPSPLAVAEFQSPPWLGFLQAQPNGYLPTSPGLYAGLVPTSPPDVQAWVEANQPGTYTVEPLFEFFNLPFFDPGEARVPGLIIQGEDDPQSLPSDVEDLADAYGKDGVVGVVTIAGGGHIPRLEAGHNAEYWDAVTSFVDP